MFEEDKQKLRNHYKNRARGMSQKELEQTVEQLKQEMVEHLKELKTL